MLFLAVEPALAFSDVLRIVHDHPWLARPIVQEVVLPIVPDRMPILHAAHQLVRVGEDGLLWANDVHIVRHLELLVVVRSSRCRPRLGALDEGLVRFHPHAYVRHWVLEGHVPRVEVVQVVRDLLGRVRVGVRRGPRWRKYLEAQSISGQHFQVGELTPAAECRVPPPDILGRDLLLELLRDLQAEASHVGDALQRSQSPRVLVAVGDLHHREVPAGLLRPSTVCHHDAGRTAARCRQPGAQGMPGTARSQDASSAAA